VAETLSIVLLLAVLAWAVIRPWGWVESVVAVPAAAIVIGAGAISLDHVRDEAARMGPVIGFLAAVLVLARLCDDWGLFHASGTWMARLAGPHPQRLLAAVFGIASLITAILSLDATVVLLTPVVFATATRLGVRAKPHVYACTHLSNSGSLVLPVSNLTNLLAFAATGLTFTRFTALMALPWVVAVGAEYGVFRRFFAADLNAADEISPPPERPEVPVYAIAVVALTLAGFVITSAVGVSPAWAALAGVILLAVPALLRRRTTARAIVRAAAPSFLLFVLALAIVVRAVVDNGLGTVLQHVVPRGESLPALLAIAALAALVANLINNLPATLVLLPLAAVSGPGAVLALLLGVNIGPNLTYTGSLATMLWRRTMREHDTRVDLKEFTALGLLAVPITLVVAVVALWISLRVIGA
jgi:arsenical pump membrane protein